MRYREAKPHVHVVLAIFTAVMLVAVIAPSMVGAASNPYDMVFASDQKAYVMRYGADTIWVVNPSATLEDDFKTGEIDLSQYADADGIPEMHSGIIVGNKLFVILQRLDRDNGWAPTNTSYVVVIDTATDAPIQKIDLPVVNPVTIQYLAENQTIYIACAGGFFDPASNGGIVTLDPTSYATGLLIDGDPYVGISGLIVISSTKGYFIGYGGWQANSLYTFDPSNPAPTIVNGFDSLSLGGMESGVSLDKNELLWVCNQTSGQVDLLDTATDLVAASVSTNLNPLNVVFSTDGTVDYGVIATVAADYSSGAHSVVTVDDAPRTTRNNLDPSGSDVAVVAQGRYFYRLERSNANNITKYDVSAPDTVVWQFSTEDPPSEDPDDGDDDSLGCFIDTLF